MSVRCTHVVVWTWVKWRKTIVTSEDVESQAGDWLCCCAVDVDECSTDPCGPGKVDCTNSDGSYTCTCKPGYEVKDGACIGPSPLLLLIHYRIGKIHVYACICVVCTPILTRHHFFRMVQNKRGHSVNQAPANWSFASESNLRNRI